MSRVSARFFAIKTGWDTRSVYNIWKEMGLVIKDKFGDWALTPLGHNIGGRMSKSSYTPVPTFDFDIIEKMTIDFYNKFKKKF